MIVGNARNHTWQGLASGCNASDRIARDLEGRDQSVITLHYNSEFQLKLIGHHYIIDNILLSLLS